MRPWCLLVLALLVALPAGPRPAGARPGPPATAVVVDVATAGGRSLGRLTGERDDRVTYFSVGDVARLVGGVVRYPGAGTATLRVRGKTVVLRQGDPVVRVAGRRVTLTAPVRRHQATWLVPGDLLLRVMPVVLGTGLRVVAVTTPAAPVAPRGVRAVPASAPAAGLPAAPPGPRLDAAPASKGEPKPIESGDSRDERRPASPPEPATVAPPPEEAAISAPLERPTRLGSQAGPVELRHRSYPTYTRVVLEGPRTLDPRLVEQRDGLLVALAGWSGPAPRSARVVRDGLVGELELTEARGTPALRVTFERAPGARKVFRLTDPPRLVLDFYRTAPPPEGRPRPGAPGLRTIVLDPGHGGHDPGAIGPGGLQEKELTLDIARRVAALLQEDLGVRVVLTRARDQFLALRERTTLANREKADLFVSIHVNAAPGMTASGTEAYFLSSEATDNAARAAAAFENRLIALEANAGGAARDVLRSILWDLTQSDFQQESSRLAEALQTSLERALRLPGRGVKQAPFYVLGGAAMPAVLVEIGFLTNPQEEQRLRDEGYRDRIARALAAGVAAHKRDYEQRAAVTVKR